MLIRSLFFVALFTLAFSSAAAAADWPQYRGAAWDGKSTEVIGGVDWSAGPKLVWKEPTPLGFSSFAVAGGRAFTLVAEDQREGEQGESKLAQMVVAMDTATGERLWAHAMNPSEYQKGGHVGAPGNRGGDGPRSTPTVDGNRVYAYDSEMLVVCLDAATGDLIWQQDIKQDFAGQNIPWSNATSPVIEGDAVFVVGGGQSESMIALNKHSGEVLWKTGDEQMTHATPMLATIHGRRQAIFYMQSGLVSLDPTDGAELWRTAYPYNVSSAAMPVVTGDLVYISAGYGVGAGLFRIGTGSQVEDVWQKTNQLMNHWSTPVVHDGHLYGIYEFKKFGKAPLQCVELATGEIKWKQRGYGQGNVILVGDKLVALSDAGEVAIVSARPDKYEELARAQVLAGKCWSTPAYSEGKIYVRSTVEGACIEL